MADFQADAGHLCRGIHFSILTSSTMIIECSFCDETGSIFHSGETYDASLSGKWIAKAAEHLIREHPDKMGMIGV